MRYPRVGTASCVVLAVSSLMLHSCASVSRVKHLEDRMSSSEARLESLHVRLAAAEASAVISDQRMAAAGERSQSSERKIAALQVETVRIDENVSKLSRRVGAIESVIDWTGRFRVTVPNGGGWHTLYANSTGQSQRLRIRRISHSGEAQVRIGEMSRTAVTITPEVADSGITAGVTPPSWDMSSKGSQRWNRIGCGQELSGRAPLLEAQFEILVTADPQPIRC